jgi:RNA polymerase sigma-70 factor (sigma-E family)
MTGEDFGTFVHHSGPRLLRYAVLLCGQRSDAEDLLQDALVRVYPRWGRLRNQQPEAYVRKVMTNRLISRWRSPWSRRRVPELPDQAVPVDEVARVDDRDVLLAALRSLPPQMRAVIVLRYWLGYTEQETAAELGCSIGSVKSQSSRGIQRLRMTVPSTRAPELNGGR